MIHRHVLRYAPDGASEMDESRYGDLLKEIRPRIIETEDEHDRLLTLAEGLMEKGDKLSEEEREALGLIVLLIEAFESTVEDEESEDDGEDEGPPAPHVALARLMQSHRVELEDIAPIFGNPHLAREALDGKRPISRGQAKELGRYFRVPPKLFQEG
jgi:HTH-type transcriptional regulator/antitoxin HigA